MYSSRYYLLRSFLGYVFELQLYYFVATSNKMFLPLTLEIDQSTPIESSDEAINCSICYPSGNNMFYVIDRLVVSIVMLT